jgi:hypothetical protein
MRLLRMAGCNRDIVEEAKAHRLRALGMVPGRAHGHEGVLDLPGHHLIDRLHSPTGRAQRRFERAR